MITEQHKQELLELVPMEKEDLDVLKGGTMHLATLEQMAKIVDYLRSKGYDPTKCLNCGADYCNCDFAEKF